MSVMRRCVLAVECCVCVCLHADVAASAYGRDFLSSCEEGLALVDVFCATLAEAPTGAEWY